jgi:hypothetical protein
VDRLDCDKSGVDQLGSDRFILGAAELEQEDTAVSEELCRAPKRTTQELSPVVPAIERDLRLICEDITRQKRERWCWHVGHDADDDIDGCIECPRQCGVELTLVDLHTVRTGTLAGDRIDLARNDPDRWRERAQRQGERARTGAQIDSEATISQVRNSATDERLALPSRHVDAGKDQHPNTAKEHGSDDPCKWLSLDTASEHRAQLLGAIGGTEQLIGLFFGCDAACRAEFADEFGAGQSIGSSQISGITRVVRDWFRANPAFVFNRSAAIAAYSSPSVGVAVAWNVLPGISTVTSGLATRL